METIRVNMTPCEDVQTIHASQFDTEAREWGFELHNNGDVIDSSEITDQIVFKAYEGGTEQLLPENGSVPVTAPFLGDIRYPQGLLTDQEFTYRQSPTEEDGLANIVGIKGQTLKWNQLVQNGNFASTSGWTVYHPANASITANSNVLTETLTISTLAAGNAYTIGLQKTNVIPDATHKYLCFVTITLSFTSNVRIELGGSAVLGTNPINANTKTTLSVVSTAFTYNKNLLIYPQSGVVGIDLSGQTIKYENIMLIDLTQMFGAGKEPATVEEFTSLFPLPYYSYNAGTLLSFNGTGLKTVGKNQINLGDSKSTTANGVTASYDASTQKVTLSGTNTKTDGAYILIVFYPSALPKFKNGENYVVSASSQIPTNTYFNLVYRDTNNTLKAFSLTQIETRRAWRFTVPSNYSEFVSFQIGVLKEARQVSGEFGIQLEFGSSVTSYEPYTESVINLPISQYFPTGMKSIEPNQYTTVEITDELIPTKATTRVGSITIDGNTPMNPNGATSEISAFIMPINGKANGRYNIMSDLFEASNGTLYSIAGRDANNNVQFALPPSVPQTSAGGQAWFAQHPTTLYFELATPTETEITTASLVTENGEIPLYNEDGTLIGKCTEQLSSESGFFDAKIKLADADGECYSNKLQLHVERSPQ